MLPHPEITRVLVEQRITGIAGAAASAPRRRLRTRVGLVLVAFGSRLAADALPARRPQRLPYHGALGQTGLSGAPHLAVPFPQCLPLSSPRA